MTTSTSTDGSPKTERSDGPDAPEPAAPGGAPSAELLEFLGEFSDDTGEWIDPLEIDDPEPREPDAEPRPVGGDD